MMIGEFIARVGFEPTIAEYQEIEREYLGCDIDKDAFCEQWLKNGGIRRLSRQRARKIEELEDRIAEEVEAKLEAERKLGILRDAIAILNAWERESEHD